MRTLTYSPFDWGRVSGPGHLIWVGGGGDSIARSLNNYFYQLPGEGGATSLSFKCCKMLGTFSFRGLNRARVKQLTKLCEP